MNRHRVATGAGLVLILTAVTAFAGQGRTGPRARAGAADRSRLPIVVMEGALERAVEETHARQIEAVLPAVFGFEGGARARGFHLEGYGVFFDVDLPPLPRGVAWSFQVLQGGVDRAAVEQIRAVAAATGDLKTREQLEQIVRRLEDQPSGRDVPVAAAEPGARLVSGGAVAGAAAAPAEDPFRGWTAEIEDALAGVVLDYGAAIPLDPGEWLTVAARETPARLLPTGPGDLTITVRIKGTDLSAFRAGRLTREDARKRMEIKES